MLLGRGRRLARDAHRGAFRTACRLYTPKRTPHTLRSTHPRATILAFRAYGSPGYPPTTQRMTRRHEPRDIGLGMEKRPRPPPLR